MSKPQDRWNKLLGEGFLRLVFLRGFLQFGLSACGLFLLFSVLRGDPQFQLHALSAFIAFPLLGLVIGTLLWLIGRTFRKKS